MTASNELERAVERLFADISDPDPVYDREGDLVGHLTGLDDVQLLLSERAELLDTVERLLKALRGMVEIDDDEVVMDTASVKERLSAARAAILKATTPNVGEKE